MWICLFFLKLEYCGHYRLWQIDTAQLPLRHHYFFDRTVTCSKIALKFAAVVVKEVEQRKKLEMVSPAAALALSCCTQPQAHHRLLRAEWYLNAYSTTVQSRLLLFCLIDTIKDLTLTSRTCLACEKFFFGDVDVTIQNFGAR